MRTFLLTGTEMDEQRTFTRDEVYNRERMAFIWGLLGGATLALLLIVLVDMLVKLIGG